MSNVIVPPQTDEGRAARVLRGVTVEGLPVATPAPPAETDDVAAIDAELRVLELQVPATLTEAHAVEDRLEDLRRRRDLAVAKRLARAFDEALLSGMTRAIGLGIPAERILLVDHTVPGRDPDVPASWGRGATVCVVAEREGRRYGVPLWRARMAWFARGGEEVAESDVARGRGGPDLELRVLGEDVTGGPVY